MDSPSELKVKRFNPLKKNKIGRGENWVKKKSVTWILKIQMSAMGDGSKVAGERKSTLP